MSKTSQQFIDEHRGRIDALIYAKTGKKPCADYGPGSRWAWCLSDDFLYNWVRRENVTT